MPTHAPTGAPRQRAHVRARRRPPAVAPGCRVSSPGRRALAQGYLARQGLTAERRALALRPRARRLYRTGDRVRPGAARSVPRPTDFQVKLRGLRIELGRSRRRSGRSATSSARSSCARQGRSGTSSWVRARGGSDVDAASLRRRCARCSGYMVPQRRQRDVWPTTSNGKSPTSAPGGRRPGGRGRSAAGALSPAEARIADQCGARLTWASGRAGDAGSTRCWPSACSRASGNSACAWPCTGSSSLRRSRARAWSSAATSAPWTTGVVPSHLPPPRPRTRRRRLGAPWAAGSSPAVRSSRSRHRASAPVASSG